MKRIITVFCFCMLCFSNFNSMAQCSGRYYDKVFPGFFDWRSFRIPLSLPSAVSFGSAVNNVGNTENTDMYIFQPQGDTLSKRPLIILAFGGSFIFGAKESPDVIALCDEFVRRGYVTASIKYRIGANPIDSVNMLKAVMRGVQDARAAVRFFYKDAATVNKYRIDTNSIFIGGVSAGAFVGMHLAYISDTNETPRWLNQIITELGGLDGGNTGSPGYSSNVRGVISLAGAIGDTSWIDAGEPPLVSMHGTDDGTVPYCSEVIEVQGNAIIEADGSGTVKARTAHQGIFNPFFTHRGGGHVDFTNYFLFSTNSTALVDTTIWFVRDFLYEVMTGENCGQALRDFGRDSVTCGQVVGDPVLTDIKPIVDLPYLTVYPNPSNNSIFIETPAGLADEAIIDVYDNLGRKLKSYDIGITGKMSIDKADIGTGLFIINVRIPEYQEVRRKVIFQ